MTTIQSIPLSSIANGRSRGASQEFVRWAPSAVAALFALPFADLLYRAQQVHREHFDANEVQLSTLLSIKTGGCAEDCGYCPQSAHFDTDVKAGKLLAVEEVVEAARAARAQGATRFCMGAAWRSPKARDMGRLTAMVGAVKALGLETCMTLGMLEADQALALREAGLDYYNHNLDSAPDFYNQDGDKLLTTANPQAERDCRLLERLGMAVSKEAA